MADWFDALLCVDVGIVTQKLALQYCWGFVCLCSFFYITKSVFTLHVEACLFTSFAHQVIELGGSENPLFSPDNTTSTAPPHHASAPQRERL